ncbi:MAG: flagellar hook-basal body complex protein FliE [Rhodobacterales bacterium]|nr:flagellar hook-basal body complex protein FliE [Rhodobacterales bacterium]
MDIASSLAAQAYSRARPATDPQPREIPEPLAAAAGSFAETLARADRTAQAALAGEADPHALVQALAASQSAVETVVAVRDRVVEAYQEILRMPV